MPEVVVPSPSAPKDASSGILPCENLAMVVGVDNSSQDFAIMITLQENLNMRIGTERWKKYITAIFWYYISMPINFVITLFTAMSSGQVGTQTNYLSTGTLFAILFTAFILSTVNTFFKLKELCDASYKILQQFEAYSIEFENIYFQAINSDADVQQRLQKYRKLQQDINTFCKDVEIDNISYLSECLYSCIKRLCLNRFFKSKLKLINVAERFWLLDGKKKTLHYNKKYLVVNMDNFVLDTEQLPDEFFATREADVAHNRAEAITKRRAHTMTRGSQQQQQQPQAVPSQPVNNNNNISFHLQEISRGLQEEIV
jgi:hypothetical protein